MAEQNKAEKFVFYMYKMTKSYPPNKEVLKDISLSFSVLSAWCRMRNSECPPSR